MGHTAEPLIHPAVLLFGPEYLRHPWLLRLDPSAYERYVAPMLGHLNLHLALRDMLDLLHGQLTSPEWLTAREREAAIGRLVSPLLPGLRNPKARRALHQRATALGMPPAALLRQSVLPASVLQVVDTIETPRRIQVATHRVKDPAGRWTPMRPLELRPQPFVPWFRQALYSAAGAILLDRSYPRTRREPLEQPALVSFEASDFWCAPDTTLETHTLLAALATPREQTLVALLDEGYSRAEAAARMGIHRATVDVLWFRLQKKLGRR
jgi:DNA-binding CsgD family transcriptional regulator